MREPLWVMSNLAPQRALEIYFGRMKIEESFRDPKALLGLDRVMSQTRHNMEQLAALTMMAYTVGRLVGEAMRDELFGGPRGEPTHDAVSSSRPTPAQRKWQHYSGLLLVLRQQLRMAKPRLSQLVSQVLAAFACFVRLPIPASG